MIASRQQKWKKAEMNVAGGRLMSTETPSRFWPRINYGERLLDGVLMAAHSGVRNLCPAAIIICLVVILLIGCSGAPVEPIGVDPVIDSLETELKQTREALYHARCLNKCYREMFPDSAVCQCGV